MKLGLTILYTLHSLSEFLNTMYHLQWRLGITYRATRRGLKSRYLVFICYFVKLQTKVLSKVLEYYIKYWLVSKNMTSGEVKHYWSLCDDILVNNDVIYYHNNRIIIPHTLRGTAPQWGHNGVIKTMLRAKHLVYWPRLNNELQQVVLKRNVCDVFRSSNIKESLITHVVYKLPFEFISTDYRYINLSIMWLYSSIWPLL